MTAYEQLCGLAREIALLGSSASVLGWDQETWLPQRGIHYRARQIAWLEARGHSLATGARFRKLLDRAEKEPCGRRSVTAANLREWRHALDRAVRIPSSFVARMSEASSLARQAWMEARKASDFALFSPHLKTLLQLSRRKADLLGYADEPYDALLEGYERGTRTRTVTALFENLAPQIAKLAAKASERSSTLSESLPRSRYPIQGQQILNREVAESLGFDFSAGRIDTTTHPFCTTLGPADVRLTTRYDETDFTSSLLGVLHEAGHGMYEQGLPEADYGLPSGSAVSLGIHESQSRLWENHVGKSKAFWEKWFPRAQEIFPSLRKITLERFFRSLHRAGFSFIRVEADEATYDLHIFLRFELERLLLNGSLDVDLLPEAWNERFEKLFGIRPPDDSKGCLQDIHWSMGGFGYFPTYTLGNLNAAQLFSTAMSGRAVSSAARNAEYGPLLAWLRANVHSRGCTLHPGALMKSATGRDTEAAPYLSHLRRRYLS
jgi:carboxypeptidase Taq